MNKKTFKYFICATLLAFLSMSCSDDEKFDGGDNFITTFSLSVDGENKVVSIINDTIILSVASNLELKGAKVEYTLSENATIYPDPTTYEKWNEEAIFVVKSHSSSLRKYKYTIKYLENGIDGNITLRTQEDVDAFASNGLTKVNGSLIIGKATGKDSIYTLSHLGNLEEISYNLIINPTYAGKEVIGLESLKTLGSLVTDTKLHTLSRIYLPNLRTVNLGIEINNQIQSLDCPALETVQKDVRVNLIDSEFFNVGLGLVQHIGGDFVIKNSGQKDGTRHLAFPKLKTVGGAFSISTYGLSLQVPELESCGGEFTLAQSKVKILSVPKLKEVGNSFSLAGNGATYIDFPMLEKVGKDFNLVNQPASVINFSKLVTIGGDFSLNKLNLSSLSGFKSISAIEGKFLNLTGLSIEDLDDMSKLKKIQILNIKDCSAMKELDLTKLEIEMLMLSGMDEIKIVSNPILETKLQLTKTQPIFEGVTEIKELRMDWGYGTTLFSYELSGVTTIGKLQVNVQSCESFSLPDLVEVVDDFKFTWNSSEFEGLTAPKLNKVGGDFSFLVSGSAKEFKFRTFTLPKLAYVGGDFTVATHNNTKDEDIEEIVMPALETIEGTLIIKNGGFFSSNNNLTNLDGFITLKKLSGLQITKQVGLKSYEGLKNAFPTIDKDNWKVTGNGYNPTYDDLAAGKWSE